jgi:murein DD-endopeptidase MepM/ murein hydrolase activator NlpD
MASDANPSLGSNLSSRSPSSSPFHQSDTEPASPRPLGPFRGSARHEVAATVAIAAPFGRPATDEAAPSTQASKMGRLVQRCQEQFRQTLADQVAPLRLAGHLAVLAVGGVILILSQMTLPEWDFTINALPNNALAGVNTVTIVQPNEVVMTNSESMSEALQRSAVPFTVVQEKERASITTYTVAAGDTVLGIAAKFGLQPETILWANSNIEQNPDRLAIGDVLNILPFDGVLHVVKAGDTLSGLAAKFKVDASTIVDYEPNGLTDVAAPLTIGSQIVIPNGTKPFVSAPTIPSSAVRVAAPDDATVGSGSFSWPASGNITQQFWGGHRAIDIGSWTGAPVKAADSGYVIVAGGGWNGGYGNHVIIDHGNGFTTLYAHMNSIFVRPGESVSRGQQIGTVGNTGNSTGPHLHFEIQYQGSTRNPFNWLP